MIHINRNNISINEALLLEQLTNLLTYFIATLSRDQTDGLQMEREVRPGYLFIPFIRSFV